MSILVQVAALAVLAQPTVSAANAAWSQLAQADVDALVRLLDENHPGVVDPQNPAVRTWLDRSRARARTMAASASSYEADYFTLRRFVKGFNDAHVVIYQTVAPTKVQFPGFVVAFRAGRFEVVDSEAPDVPVGAEVASCDRTDAEALYQANVLSTYGVENVRADYIGYAPYLFADFGDPFVQRPSSCVLRGSFGSREVRLNWRSIARDKLVDRLHRAAYGASADLGMEEWRPGYFWIGLPSFALTADDGSLTSNADRMNQLIKQASDRAAELRAAKAIVFDIRGNDGGSSAWGDRLLQAIWGEHATEDLEKQTYDAVEWRVSPGNIAANKRYAEAYLTKFGAKDPTYLALSELVKKMEAGQARGEKLVAVTDDPPDRTKARRPIVTPRLILLGNGSCFSACNDFSDEVLSYQGAELWGADNAADSVYIDNRGETLPSGLFRVSLPMKVWRGRYRGNNVSYSASRHFDAPFATQQDAQRWVDEQLAKSK